MYVFTCTMFNYNVQLKTGSKARTPFICSHRRGFSNANGNGGSLAPAFPFAWPNSWPVRAPRTTSAPRDAISMRPHRARPPKWRPTQTTRKWCWTSGTSTSRDGMRWNRRRRRRRKWGNLKMRMGNVPLLDLALFRDATAGKLTCSQYAYERYFGHDVLVLQHDFQRPTAHLQRQYAQCEEGQYEADGQACLHAQQPCGHQVFADHVIFLLIKSWWNQCRKKETNRKCSLTWLKILWHPLNLRGNW